MRKGIHPDYVECTVLCSCGNTFKTRATKPNLHVELCNECHPFFTGQQKFVDTGGRVQRFADKFGSASAVVAEREDSKRKARQEAAAAADVAAKAAREEKAAKKAEKAAKYADKVARAASEKPAQDTGASVDAAAAAELLEDLDAVTEAVEVAEVAPAAEAAEAAEAAAPEAPEAAADVAVETPAE